MKEITTRSGITYEGPSIPTSPSPKKAVEQETEETTDKEQTNFQGSTAHIQPLVVPISKPDVPKTLPKPNIPYPSRLNDQKLREKATNQMENNTIPNPKGEMKAITTRSGVTYEGPSIPTPKKVVKRETEETTNKEQTNFHGSTT
nr:reverse transcriptase domain-containing protein [Tanacetum cinerariifolium]